MMDNDEEEEAQRAAFAAFMLQGKGAAAASPSKPSFSSFKPSSTTTTPNKHNNIVMINRKYQTLHKALAGKLRDWQETHVYLAQTVGSIANLRTRVQAAHKMAMHNINNNTNATTWNGGWSSPSSAHQEQHYLTLADMELALYHDVQHLEQALSSLRTNLSTLNQDQESLGRRLEDLMLYHDDVNIITTNSENVVSLAIHNDDDYSGDDDDGMYAPTRSGSSAVTTTTTMFQHDEHYDADDDDDDSEDETVHIWAQRIDDAEVVWGATALELYRLQELAPAIWNAQHLLEDDNNNDDLDDNNNDMARTTTTVDDRWLESSLLFKTGTDPTGTDALNAWNRDGMSPEERTKMKSILKLLD